MTQVTCRRAVLLYLICPVKDKDRLLLVFLITYIFMSPLSDLERITRKMPESLQARNGSFICQVM